MNPEENCLDPNYQREEGQNPLDVAKVIVLQNECYYVAIEEYLSNPEMIGLTNLITRCGMCPFCRNETKKMFPLFSREGTTSVLFNLFNPSPTNQSVDSSNDLWTIDTVVKKIREYPNSAMLISRSSVKGGLRPDTIKRIIFVLVTCGILQLNYHTSEKQAVFSLAHSANVVGTFALVDEHYWANIETK